MNSCPLPQPIDASFWRSELGPNYIAQSKQVKSKLSMLPQVQIIYDAYLDGRKDWPKKRANSFALSEFFIINLQLHHGPAS